MTTTSTDKTSPAYWIARGMTPRDAEATATRYQYLAACDAAGVEGW